MKTLYSIAISVVSLLLHMAGLYNPKLKKGIVGRRETFEKLRSAIQPKDAVLWFHCASLGEYEQGLPVFEALKEKYPNRKVVLSFFSPSGYENKKNAPIADVVVYLPLDKTSSMKTFLDLTHPDLIVFVKYEFWPNLLSEIKRRQLKAILISAIIRKDQSFFKWYGGFMKKALFAFEHIFVQDEASKRNLLDLGYQTVTVSGDTRFDRVTAQLQLDNQLDMMDTFKDGKLLVVFGSSWPADDDLFIPYINEFENNNVKFVITPHDVKLSYTEKLVRQIDKKMVTYSGLNTSELKESVVFIVDTIGILNKIYSYADIAYVGGAAGTTGLHNILEPAVFGIPVIIGKNYSKFPEASKLIDLGGVVSVDSPKEFKKTITHLLKDESTRLRIGKINHDYITENSGAVTRIMTYFSK
ncbi:glycosyltransferase N-terminal domain-containing protein [Winogradskyella maritima]|uniref:3-deoxy-D-manno-octulosonic acid transferase n=1 Tax=Winogradskyella maritima TaxID=1517766 RepID=A0ABV8AGQ5_9FLAO|nr:glycosyltransferase N-terminal domain-containing protein [Winogradskyella maritima]